MIAQKTLTPTLERISRQRLYLPFFHFFITGGFSFFLPGLGKETTIFWLWHTICIRHLFTHQTQQFCDLIRVYAGSTLAISSQIAAGKGPSGARKW